MQPLPLAFAAWCVSCVALGLVCGVVLCIQFLRGKLVVHGYGRYVRTIWHGRLIIASNHSTVLNSPLLLAICWPWAMLCPWWWFFWNVSAHGVMPRWAAPLTRTILVKRDESGNTDVWRFMHILLRVFGGVVGIAPEGGRTNTPHDPSVEAGERFWWSEDDRRKLRNFNVGKQTKVPTLAITTGSRILPVEVRVPFSDRADFISDTIQEWFRSGETITIMVGEPYYPDPAQTLTEQNFELGLRMLAIPGRRSRQ